MTATLALWVGLWLGFAEDESQSGALFQTLPEDGVWAKYDVALKIDNQEVALAWQARSVGKGFHDGKECRLLELEQHSPDANLGINFPRVIWRLMVPESEFGSNKHPLSKAVKVWRKEGEQDSVLHDSLVAADSLFAGFVSGPQSDVKRGDSKAKHSWQRGELECDVVSGRGEALLNTAKFTLQHRVLREKSVPFGFVATHAELSIEGQATKITAKVLLVDYGKGAEPKLPQLMP